MIEGSGTTICTTVSENDIVAMDSMNKFLKGRMYNRCRRGNILFASKDYTLRNF